MRILFVSAYGAWGRPASYIKTQSDSLRKLGVDVTDFYFEKGGVSGYWQSYQAFRKFIRDKAFDVVHAHFGYTAFVVKQVPFKAKFVISFMGDDLYGILNDRYRQTVKGRFNMLMANYLQTKADWIVVKSRRMQQLILPKYKHLTTVLPNGVDFEKFPLIDRQAARHRLQLDPQKKYLLFLGRVDEKRKNFRLVQEAHRLLADDQVQLLNPFPLRGEDVHWYLNACDVLVMASTLEGSPNVIKEALVCNCPIVSTDVGDVPERIKGVEGCYLTDSDPAQMQLTLRKALAFNSRTNGRALSNDLKAEAIARRLVTIYQGLLSGDVTESKSSFVPSAV